MGFRLPLTQWFRGRLRDLCYDRICAGGGLPAQLWNGTELRKLLDDHVRERKDNWLQIWTLLGLAIWSDLFCHRPIAAARRRFATVGGSGA